MWADEEQLQGQVAIMKVTRLLYVMSCHVMSCHVMSCHVMSCHIM